MTGTPVAAAVAAAAAGLLASAGVAGVTAGVARVTADSAAELRPDTGIRPREVTGEDTDAGGLSGDVTAEVADVDVRTGGVTAEVTGGGVDSRMCRESGDAGLVMALIPDDCWRRGVERAREAGASPCVTPKRALPLSWLSDA